MKGPYGVVCWLLVICLALSSCTEASGKSVALDADVLILGAGMAGISAANTLSKNNITDFLLIEAEERIGGRVKSVILPSTHVRVELGANWIQGIDPKEPGRHPLWRIVQSCGGLGGQFVKDFNNGTMHVFDEYGKNISDDATFKERFSYWNKALDPGLAEYAIKRQKEGLPDVTVRDGLRALGWDPITLMDYLIEWYGFDLDEQGTTPDYISLYQNFPDSTYDEFGNPNRSENYFVNDQAVGFEKVVRCLAQNFLSKNDKRLILNTVVEAVHSYADYVCVAVKQSGAEKVYCAKYIITTFSIGVLQSQIIKFVPSLPEYKVSAFNSCNLTLYLKIFLEFDQIFWDSELNVDNFLRIDPVRGRFVQYQPVNNQSPVLFVTVTGEMAKTVYHQSVDETSQQIMDGLRLIYGPSIPDPTSVLIPDWAINPLFQGMFMINRVGCDESSRSCVFLRICNKC